MKYSNLWSYVLVGGTYRSYSLHRSHHSYNAREVQHQSILKWTSCCSMRWPQSPHAWRYRLWSTTMDCTILHCYCEGAHEPPTLLHTVTHAGWLEAGAHEPPPHSAYMLLPKAMWRFYEFSSGHMQEALHAASISTSLFGRIPLVHCLVGACKLISPLLAGSTGWLEAMRRFDEVSSRVCWPRQALHAQRCTSFFGPWSRD